MRRTGVPVSERAVIQRINRALALQGQKMRKTRGWRAHHELGDYYVVVPSRNFIVAQNIDLEAFARELEVLAPYERLDMEV